MCRNVLRSLVAVVLVLASLGARATFHLWVITQAYSNADGSVQYIELAAYASGQQFVADHTIVATQGSTTHSFTIPRDLPGDTALTTSDGYGYYGGAGSTTYRSMVIGTQGFAALGVVTPDYVVPNGFLFTSGGTLRWGEGADVWSYPALPTDGNLALFRTGVTGDNAPMNFNGQTGRITLTGATANTPGALSGLWWNAAESGWGIDLTQRRNVIFAAWYTYDTSGNPKWYVASACTMASAGTSGTCNGTLFEVNGPTFFAPPFNPSMVNVTNAGSLAITFQDASNASLTYTLGTQTRTVAITRQPIAGGSIPGVDYTDLWWNSSESGWGLAIAQQGSVMFLAWYVYDSSGKPTWYVASSCAVSGTSCSGALFRTSGPPFGPTFDPTAVHVTQAGTVSVAFGDPNNGVLSYTVNGVTATKNITRQAF